MTNSKTMWCGVASTEFQVIPFVLWKFFIMYINSSGGISCTVCPLTSQLSADPHDTASSQVVNTTSLDLPFFFMI